MRLQTYQDEESKGRRRCKHLLWNLDSPSIMHPEWNEIVQPETPPAKRRVWTRWKRARRELAVGLLLGEEHAKGPCSNLSEPRRMKG